MPITGLSTLAFVGLHWSSPMRFAVAVAATSGLQGDQQRRETAASAAGFVATLRPMHLTRGPAGGRHRDIPDGYRW